MWTRTTVQAKTNERPPRADTRPTTRPTTRRPLSALRRVPGFTLLEMMLVVVIIGVLAGLAIWSMGGTSDEARRQATMVKLRSVHAAIQTYNGTQNAFPSSLQDLVRARLLETLPTDGWKRPFSYSVNEGGDPDRPYELRSFGRGGPNANRPEDILDLWVILKQP